jgi:hypothetical protein
MPITMTIRQGSQVRLKTGAAYETYTVLSVNNGQVELQLTNGYGTNIDFRLYYAIADFERRVGFKLDPSLLTPASLN